MIDLDGYRVVVTGGSRGIGAACCRAFSQAGAAVLVHYRNQERAAAEVLASLHPPTTGEHLGCRADLGEPEGVDALFELVRKRWGALNCLVNNAGIWLRNPLRDLDPAKLEETWRVNVRALFLAGRQAVPLLEATSDGSIVNVASTAGQRGEAFYSPYAASKGAVIAMTKAWSTELAPRIRVNAVAPGWVDTDMSAEAYADGGRERIVAEIPLRRIPPAEDIAGPILFLASPLARHVTGETLSVNGGSVLAG